MANPMFDVIKGDLAQLEEHLLQAVTAPEPDITEIGSHLITSGGKRLRPALCLLAAHGGPKFELARVMPLAAALELIHTASLVHDDVIDAADTRRGAATVNARWNNQVAILSGDFVFARAFAMVAEQGYGKSVLKGLADLVGNLSIGEIIQDRNVYKASRDVADYYARIKKKTADFLETCCALGAEVGGMTQEEVARLADYGHAIGMAFQITDDLLDILETEEQTGKPAGNDIRQGILTLPVIRAMEVSPDAEELASIVTNPEMTPEMAERALAIVRATDGVDVARDKADEYLATAKASLPAALPSDIREAFELVADFIGERNF